MAQKQEMEWANGTEIWRWHEKTYKTLTNVKNCLSVSWGPSACPWLSRCQSYSDPSYQLLIVLLPSHVQRGWSWKREVSKYQVSSQKAASQHRCDSQPQLQKQSLLWFRPRIYAIDTHGVIVAEASTGISRPGRYKRFNPWFLRPGKVCDVDQNDLVCSTRAVIQIT